jgi:hypothetical protein
MRYVYSVVRYVPNPASGEFVNIGAIAGNDESGDWSLRQAGNPRRARQFGPLESLNAVDAFMNEIGSRLDRFALMQNEQISEAWLNDLHRRHRNVVQLSVPAPVIADSVEEALDYVFSQAIVDDVSGASTTRAYTTRLNLFSELRSSYRKAHIGQSLIRERASVLADGFLTSMDFVVGNGVAVQLAHTWSFQIQALGEVARDVKSWGFGMERLLKNGGTTIGDDAAEIRPGTPIEVVYAAPLTEPQTQIFAEAKRVFDDLGVIAVAQSAVSQVAANARQGLRREGIAPDLIDG